MAKQQPTAWRHRIVWIGTQRVSNEQLEAVMDAEGVDGWELVNFQSTQTGMRCVFKRPATEEEVAEIKARPKEPAHSGPDREAELERMRQASAQRERELRVAEQERLYRENMGRQFSQPVAPPIAGVDR